MTHHHRVQSCSSASAPGLVRCICETILHCNYIQTHKLTWFTRIIQETRKSQNIFGNYRKRAADSGSSVASCIIVLDVAWRDTWIRVTPRPTDTQLVLDQEIFNCAISWGSTTFTLLVVLLWEADAVWERLCCRYKSKINMVSNRKLHWKKPARVIYFT